eukprot:12691377-Ditylum_brightwellii.AAC.1
MATSDESDVIVDFTNIASCTNQNKRVEVAEIYMKLKISKGRVSCRDLVLEAKVGKTFALWIIREVDGTGLAPKTKSAIFGPGARCLSYED